jgi:hypothetical protein
MRICPWTFLSLTYFVNENSLGNFCTYLDTEGLGPIKFSNRSWHPKTHAICPPLVLAPSYSKSISVLPV